MNKTTKRPPVGLLPTERIAYSPIAGRKALKLPGDARMVVWCIVNVEEWDILSPMPRTVLTPPAGGAPSPDIPNWAWHEYGNRVGFWRMLKVFDDFHVQATLAIHPYISGQPHRIKYLEQIYDHVARHEGVLHWNGEQILDWYQAQTNANAKAAE